MSHGHDHHTGGHHHALAPASFGFAFAIATILNIVLVVAQIIFGLAANSIALLADAGHNFGDVLGLLLAWGAQVVARWQPTERFTYGFRSASILSALLNAVTLLVATGAIAWEAIGRLPNPGEVGGLTVMVLAAIGIVVNGVSAWLLMGGRDDLNVRGAFLHLAADAAVSAGVVVAGAVILLTGWSWIDPAVSLAICAVIVWGTWGLLRESVRLSLGAVPSQVALADVRLYLESLRGRHERARPARVGHEHDGECADRASGDARGASGRRLHRRGLARAGAPLPDRAPDLPDRARRRRQLRLGAGAHRLRPAKRKGRLDGGEAS